MKTSCTLLIMRNKMGNEETQALYKMNVCPINL